MTEPNAITLAVERKFAGKDKYDLGHIWIAQSKSFLWGTMHWANFKRTDGSVKTVYAWEGERDEKTGELKEGIQVFEDADEIASFVSSSRSDIWAGPTS